MFEKHLFFKEMESLARVVSTLSSHKGTCRQHEIPIRGYRETVKRAWHEALRGALEGTQGTSKWDKPLTGSPCGPAEPQRRSPPWFCREMLASGCARAGRNPKSDKR